MTTLTTAATYDDLTDSDYRDIYDEIRAGHALRGFIEVAGSTLSASWWSQWEKGGKNLTRRARNDLRRAVGLPLLPPTVEEAVAAHVHPDATVARVGDDPQARRVLLLATGDDVTVTWNGSGPQMAASADVTGVARTQPENTVRRSRRTKRAALSVSVELHEQLNAARQRAGLSWPAFLSRLVEEDRNHAEQ